MLFKRKERNMFICLKDAVKKYGEGEAAVYALDHADLVIGKGEICAILGPSGSGKSTILNMLGLSLIHISGDRCPPGIQYLSDPAESRLLR